MTHSLDTLLGWRGATAYDHDGEKLGKIGDLYLDRASDVPAYAGIRTGLLGRHESIVPLAGAEERDGEVHLPYPAELVREAPSLDPEAALDEDQEHALAEHYGGGPAGSADAESSSRSEREEVGATERPEPEAVDATERSSGREPREATPPVEDDRPDVTPHSAEDEPVTMVRSEEEVRVTAGELRPAEKVRLRKVMVTEQVEKTVPVRREVIQLEHEPAPEGTVESVEDVDEPEVR